MSDSILKFFIILILISSCKGNEDITDENPPITPDNKPTISMILPNTGSIGDEILIIGKNFGEINSDIKVFFGDGESRIKSTSKDKLIVSVPENDGIVDVRVKVNNQFSNSLIFTYKEAEEKLKILSNGMFVPIEVEEATTFRGVSHIRLKNGDIFIVTSSLATISIDGGKTWLEPQKLHDDWTGAIRSIIETKNGSVVFTSMKLLHNYGRHAVLTYTTKDNGATWTASNILDSANSRGHHSGLMESTVVQLNDGRLWHLIRTNRDYIYESFSSDTGLTWDTPKKTNFDASSSPHSIIRLKSGRLILVWNRLYPEGETSTPRYGVEKDPNLSEVAASWMRHELSISFSDDDGKTWTTPRLIARYMDYTQPEDDVDSSKWISYGHLVELDPGIIMITTESGGLRIKIKETDFYK